MIKKFKKSKAFTIIELIIVIVVIGILFVAFLSKTDNTTDKAKLAGVKADFRSFYTATKKVGLESQLNLLSEIEFEKLLNDNLDKPLQFKNGISTEKDPWNENYVYATKVDKDTQTFYIMFASKGGNQREFLSIEDVAKADGDSVYNVSMGFKQVKTEFSALNNKSGEDAVIYEELWDKINDEFGEDIVLEESAELEGSGQDYHQLAPSVLTFRSPADIDDFEELRINGEVVDPSNYTVTEGSTIITLPIEYLESLEDGNHSIEVVSKTMTVSGNFTVTIPKKNEYSFYYNQPYTAYLPAFGGYTSFFIRENGTYDIITVDKIPDAGTYVINGQNITATHPLLGNITCVISNVDNSIYCNEVSATFRLSDEHVLADNDYIYFYNNDIEGYTVSTIDRTKSSHEEIKSNVNGKPVKGIANYAYYGNSNLVTLKIPVNITKIGSYAFNGCINLQTIEFEGTAAQWNAIQKSSDWNRSIPAAYVQCTDGQVQL